MKQQTALDRDNFLKQLTKEDLPDGSFSVLVDYLSIDNEQLKKEPYYVGDDMDLVRYLLRHLGGFSLRIPRWELLQHNKSENPEA